MAFTQPHGVFHEADCICRRLKEKSTQKTSPAVANGALGSTTGTVHMLIVNKKSKTKIAFCACFAGRMTQIQVKSVSQNFKLFTVAVSVKKDFMSIVLLLFTTKEH